MNSIAIGQSHSILLSENGNGYVFGNNSGGQLGLSDTSNKIYSTLQLLSSPNGSNWKLFTCGAFHSIGQTENGEFFIWGQSYNGRNNKIPELIPNPSKDSKWKNFFCGYRYSIGITDRGEVYIWGNGKRED